MADAKPLAINGNEILDARNIPEEFLGSYVGQRLPVEADIPHELPPDARAFDLAPFAETYSLGRRSSFVPPPKKNAAVVIKNAKGEILDFSTRKADYSEVSQPTSPPLVGQSKSKRNTSTKIQRADAERDIDVHKLLGHLTPKERQQHLLHNQLYQQYQYLQMEEWALRRQLAQKQYLEHYHRSPQAPYSHVSTSYDTRVIQGNVCQLNEVGLAREQESETLFSDSGSIQPLIVLGWKKNVPIEVRLGRPRLLISSTSQTSSHSDLLPVPQR